MGEGAPLAEGRKGSWLVLLVGLAAFLPDPAAAVPGRSYFFRDFSVAFYPLRLFFARELREGRVPFWNPYIYEGSFALPTFYPLDLLHVLDPSPAWVSWLLTLHLPLAAVGAYVLARELGAVRWGAFVAGSAFALGGLGLSSLNLYVFLQALALAPFLAVALRRAARQGGRWIPVAGVLLAVSVSTLAVEFVAQGVLLGLALALAANPSRPGFLRCGIAGALGLGLAAVPVAVTLGLLGETPRGAGFGRDVALANEVHPVVLLQSLVANLFGSLADPATAWWGGAFFSKGLPYFLSIYVGPLVLALAWVGIAELRERDKRVLGVLLVGAALGLWYSLGARGGLAAALSHLPGFSAFRFPSKALLLPHMALALLAGLGSTRLRRGRDWPRVRDAAACIGGVLVAVMVALWTLGAPLAQWARLQPGSLTSVRAAVTYSALGSALIALTLGVLAALAARGKVEAGRAVVLCAVLVVFDLGRAGIGMNPQVAPAFFAPLPELAALHLDALAGGRVFSYGLDHSPRFRQVLAAGGRKLAFASFFLNRQMLAPYNNMLDRVEATEATDLTSFVPRARELGPADYDPAAAGELLPFLRNAAVARVLSLDPLSHPALSVVARVPLIGDAGTIHVYGVADPAPRSYVACRVRPAVTQDEALTLPYRGDFDLAADVALEVAGAVSCRQATATRVSGVPGRQSFDTLSDGQGYLVVRDSYARGWAAQVDGAPARVLRANGKHQAVAVPGGQHHVELRYSAPGSTVGVVVFLCSLAGLLAFVGWTSRSAAGGILG